MKKVRGVKNYIFALSAASVMVSAGLQADVVTDWNDFTITATSEAIPGPPPANRVVAMVQTSVYEAVNAITKKYAASSIAVDAPENASVDAAVAAATRSMMNKLLPKMKERTDKAYEAAISELGESQSVADGIEVGLSASESVLFARAQDTIGVPESYRPVTQPGTYVPTVTPAATTWNAKRQPWALSSVDQLRPEAPPALDSERWAQDYNEIKEIGAVDSKIRTPEQTAAAHFWVATSPKVYYPVVQSVTRQEGRDLTRNARLFAMTGQAIEDSLMAVFDAKYAHNFWRPLTAIRNGDQDNNDQTERVANWKPLIKTPMHPEYPCAHCIVSGTVGTIIKLDLGSDPMPVLQSASPSDQSIVRQWNGADEFMAEVSNARVWEGVHYRYSAEVGNRMGQQVAEMVGAKFQVAN